MTRSNFTHQLNTAALWRALDTRRRQRDLSWRAVARETGLSQSTLVRLQNAELGLHADALVTLLAWLGRAEPLHDLIAATNWVDPLLVSRSAAAEELAHQLRHATVGDLNEALRLVGVTLTLSVAEED